jgi:hypothetical protein
MRVPYSRGNTPSPRGNCYDTLLLVQHAPAFRCAENIADCSNCEAGKRVIVSDHMSTRLLAGWLAGWLARLLARKHHLPKFYLAQSMFEKLLGKTTISSDSAPKLERVTGLDWDHHRLRWEYEDTIVRASVVTVELARRSFHRHENCVPSSVLVLSSPRVPRRQPPVPPMIHH